MILRQFMPTFLCHHGFPFHRTLIISLYVAACLETFCVLYISAN
uniref:Uncharacterized protein n=1 Tax=Rhizophora mucronata TaxID=61149 RepID=A0A2P2QH75_RHIMU